jgi:ATP-dependent DNA helicase RecG
VNNVLTDSVTTLTGIGEKLEEDFTLLGIKTMGDLLFYFPSRYDTYEVKAIPELIHDDQVSLVGKIIFEPNVNHYGRKKSRMQFKVMVDGVAVKAVMFNRSFAKKQLQQGKIVTLTGKWDAHRLQITVQHYKLGPPETDVAIQPFYALKGNITNARLKGAIKQAMTAALGEVWEILPQEYLDKYKLPTRQQAIQQLHFPSHREGLKHARRRFVYEELLLFQLKMTFLKYRNRKKNVGQAQRIDQVKTNAFIASLPYTLTKAQKHVLQEILEDFEAPIKMNRLLQGDVGSGKTVVAAISLFAATTAGLQGALMVPTEILAEQHYQSIVKIFGGTLSIGLLTSSVKGNKRKKLLDHIHRQEIDIVIGTHSLIQEEVIFRKLGLIIIDEQHRFGVNQRKLLREKGLHPDVLFMTATPIPRTLAITAFGDMDVSIIDELPKGRKEIETFWVKDNLLERILQFIGKRVANGEQAYVVSPLIEESEAFDYQNAVDLYEKLQTYYPNHVKLGLLHGRLHQDEKEQIMERFSNNDIHILVATTVIEVGVDVPNATIMLIYDAERFGLSQLHQLRGRVGRGDKQSYCILLADPKGEIGKERMRIMQETNDGFRLSEEDLKLRGPGDFFGKKQSGLPEFKVADLIHDYRALEVARQDAQTILKNQLLDKDPAYVHLKRYLQEQHVDIHFD